MFILLSARHGEWRQRWRGFISEKAILVPYKRLDTLLKHIEVLTHNGEQLLLFLQMGGQLYFAAEQPHQREESTPSKDPPGHLL